MLWFSWDLIAEAEPWALRVGAVAASIALLTAHDPTFSWAVLTAVCWEVGFVHFVCGYASRARERDGECRLESMALVLGRLAGKALLLATPFLIPGIFNPLGMILGMVIYDGTLLVLAAASSVRSRGPSEDAAS